MRLRVGCSGWSYPEWVGPFYPSGTPSPKFLGLYSKVFDTVEIDSTFYGVPSKATAQRWRDDTPHGFLFCPKIPQEAAGGPRAARHPGKGGEVLDATEVLREFLEVVDLLGDRGGPIVVQYPPSYARREHAAEFEELLKRLAGRRAAFEFRHASWFGEPTYGTLRQHGAALVWSENAYLDVPPEVTGDFLVVRFIGDRSFEPRGQADHPKDAALGRWASRLETRQEQVDEAFVFFNNHFEGFGPQSVNRFLARMGKSEIDWRRALADRGPAQTRLPGL